MIDPIWHTAVYAALRCTIFSETRPRATDMVYVQQYVRPKLHVSTVNVFGEALHFW